MNLIAIETATDVCGTALFQSKKLVGLEEAILNREHAEKLPIFFQQLMKKHNLLPKDLDGIAVSIGPGSFTGLRIGLSYVKGLAFSLNIPVIPVSTLHSLVSGAGITDGSVISAVHSHKDMVYHQRFAVSGGEITSSEEPSSHKWNDFTGFLVSGDILCQYGCNKLLMESSLDNKIISVVPSAGLIGEIAVQNFDLLKQVDFYQLEPNYTSHFKVGRPTK